MLQFESQNWAKGSALPCNLVIGIRKSQSLVPSSPLFMDIWNYVCYLLKKDLVTHIERQRLWSFWRAWFHFQLISLSCFLENSSAWTAEKHREWFCSMTNLTVLWKLALYVVIVGLDVYVKFPRGEPEGKLPADKSSDTGHSGRITWIILYCVKGDKRNNKFHSFSMTFYFLFWP